MAKLDSGLFNTYKSIIAKKQALLAKGFVSQIYTEEELKALKTSKSSVYSPVFNRINN